MCDSLLGDQNNFGLLERVPCLLGACRSSGSSTREEKKMTSPEFIHSHILLHSTLKVLKTVT